MTFLNPIWFLAVGAVLIPLLIHLWNIRQGKVLKVGSISLMGEASRQSSRSLRLQDILLLLLRCFLLILLAVLLATPFWNRLADNSKVKGWVMIPKQNFKEAYAKFKKPVDSLTAAGYEFHYFDAGFAKANLLEVAKDTIKISDTTIANYWDLLSQLNGKAPAKLPVSLFTENTLNHFSGSKPVVSPNLNWKTYTPADYEREWVEKAWFKADNNIKVLQGISNPQGTSYSLRNIRPGFSSGLIYTRITNWGVIVAQKSSPEQVVVADTSTFRIGLVADNGQTDATYLNAALKAIAPFIPHKVQLTSYSNATQIKQKQDWVFWLSKKPVDKAAPAIATNLLIYQTGKAQNIASWFGPGNGFEVTNKGEQVSLYQLIASPKKDADLIWRDGYGHAVLSAEKDRNFTLYRFYSRFNSAWNDLVWNDNFPRMLLGLMVGNQPSAQALKNDRRVLSAQQIMPVMAKGSQPTLAGMADDIDLSHYIWLVLILVFVLERYLSHKKITASNG